MRRSSLAATAVLALTAALAVPATAGPVRTYTGKATSTDRSFRYGKVTVKTNGTKVTLVKIESVTTTGCGGFMTVVFSPSDKETKITKGSATIRAGKLNVTYRPVADIEDQKTTLKATIGARSVTGTFESGVLCGNKGRFSAKR